MTYESVNRLKKKISSNVYMRNKTYLKDINLKIKSYKYYLIILYYTLNFQNIKIDIEKK